MKKLFAFVLALLMLLMAGCGGTPTEDNDSAQNQENAVSAIVLSSNAIEIKVGESKILSYTTIPAEAEATNAGWESADSSVATVNANGQVTGISLGQTNIIISADGGVYATCSVTVVEPSAYEQLSAKERDFVDALLRNIDDFYNPSSVIVKYIYKHSNDHGWDITVAAQNKMGGYTEKDYDLSLAGELSIPILPHIDMPDADEQGYNLDLINAALSECLGS